MTRKPETIAFWWGRLPHWEVVDGRYFVTLHLSGAIPEQGQERIHQLSEELHRLPADDLEGRLRISRHIFAEMEEWLDRAAPRSYLQEPAIAEMVMESIAFRQQRDWNMFEFVVMPTHLHLFFEVLRGSLKTVMEQFKRWTGHEAAKLADLDGGRFWQDEWFDHWSRSDEEDERTTRYIRRNPEKARLVSRYLDWPYGSWQTGSSREPSGSRSGEPSGSRSGEPSGGRSGEPSRTER